MRGHGAAHSGHQACDSFWVLQHGSTTTVAVHGFGGTTKVEVDALWPHAGQARGVLGHADRIGAEQLRAHRHARQGAAAVCQLGHVAQKDALGQQGAADADELRHAAIGPAHTREHIAQHKIQQALHRGKKQLHGNIHQNGLKRLSIKR